MAGKWLNLNRKICSRKLTSFFHLPLDFVDLLLVELELGLGGISPLLGWLWELLDYHITNDRVLKDGYLDCLSCESHGSCLCVDVNYHFIIYISKAFLQLYKVKIKDSVMMCKFFKIAEKYQIDIFN